MADIDEHGRPEPPLDGDGWETLTGFLDFQRATFAWRSIGLSAAQLARPSPPSAVTLGGLLKHLAYVEANCIDRWLPAQPRREPWASVDWAATPDWEWKSAGDDDPEALEDLWEQAVARARVAAQTAYATGGLAQPTRRRWPDGRAPSLRWVLTHMIEEYARHNGHADLIREADGGRGGEWRPAAAGRSLCGRIRTGRSCARRRPERCHGREHEHSRRYGGGMTEVLRMAGRAPSSACAAPRGTPAGERSTCSDSSSVVWRSAVCASPSATSILGTRRGRRSLLVRSC